MGAVYEGVHVETDEPAAIKVLSAALAEEPDFRQRFEAEIETLKRLYHPNIVQLFGFGEQEGHLFYAMELVDGVSLEEEVRQGRVFEWRGVARIGIEVCRALRHAHDRGITHRDIKPANLLWTRDRHVKLSDFGIAKLFGNTRLTATGNVLGTADYMAPEQADGRPTGPRSDLYSLGCVFYFLLTRHPPFRARSLLEMLEKHRNATPEPVTKYARDVPRELEILIDQLLKKDAEDRIANATLIARRLEAMLRALSAPPPVQEKRPAAQREWEFDLSPPGFPRPGTPPGNLPETRLAEEPSKPSVVPLGVTRAAEQLPETKATAAFQVYEQEGEEAAQSAGAKTEPQVTGRFTVVDRQELHRPEPEESPLAPLISPQTWILGVCLVAAGLTVWYLLRPPSADALYERIMKITEEKSIDSFRAAEGRMKEFLTRFSNDSRAERLRDYMREIELYRLERKLDLRARGMASAEGLLPIERAYLEAMNLAWLDPDRGLVKLQALVDLYKDRTDRSGPDGQCLDLARRQCKRLRMQQARSSEDSLAAVENRLRRAEELGNTDPEMAEGMWRGLVELYQDKPWAAEAVQKARQALQDLRRRSAAGPPTPEPDAASSAKSPAGEARGQPTGP